MMQKEIEQSLQNLRSHNVSPDLVKELELNITQLNEMHKDLTRAPNLATTDSELGRRSEPDISRFGSQTLADIVDEVASAKPTVSKKIICGAGVPFDLVPAKHRSPVAIRKVGGMWSDDERRAFYNGLRLFGTDFSMISATVLQKRSQKEVYKRFQREDKLNPDLINKALRWNYDNKQRLQKGFSRVLEALQIDINNFNPLENFFHSHPDRLEDIKPLEFYLLNPPN